MMQLWLNMVPQLKSVNDSLTHPGLLFLELLSQLESPRMTDSVEGTLLWQWTSCLSPPGTSSAPSLCWSPAGGSGRSSSQSARTGGDWRKSFRPTTSAASHNSSHNLHYVLPFHFNTDLYTGLSLSILYLVEQSRFLTRTRSEFWKKILGWISLNIIFIHK